MARPIDSTQREIIVDAIMNRLIEGQRLGTHTELAQEFEVSNPTVGTYIKLAYAKMPRISIEERIHDNQEAFNLMRHKAKMLLNASKDSEDARRNIDCLSKVIKEETDFLEKFHLKSKAQENIKIEVEKQLVIDSFEKGDVVDAEVLEIEQE